MRVYLAVYCDGDTYEPYFENVAAFASRQACVDFIEEMGYIECKGTWYAEYADNSGNFEFFTIDEFVLGQKIKGYESPML